MARQVKVEILGDAKGLRRAFGEAGGHADRFGRTMGKIRTGIAASFVGIAAGGAVAAAGIAKFAATSIKGWEEHQKLAAQTAAVLKSTGNAAKVTAKQVDTLSDALERKTTVDGDLIQNGANMLLTFTNIRNEVGKGNDIFNRATATVVDMSVALGQDTKSSAIQLGKALNDPIKGITALQRVGVTFTKQQKDQIKTLVEHGRTLEAQKIILAELGKEFGGSAAAQATAWGRLQVIFRQVQDQVGKALLPLVNKLADWLSDRLPGAINKAMKFFGAIKESVNDFLLGFRFGFKDLAPEAQTAFARIGDAARTAVVGIKALGAAFREGDVTSTGFVGAMEKIGVAARAVADWFSTKVLPAVRALLPFLKEMATQTGGALASAFKSVAPGLKSLWEGMQRLWPIVQVGLKVWAAYLYILWSKVIPAILKVAGPVLGFLFASLGKLIGWLANVIRWIGLGITWLVRLATGTKTTADAFETAGKRIRTTWTTTRDVIGAVVSFIIRVLRGWMDMQFTVVANILRVMGKLPGPMGAPFRKAEEAVRKARGTIDTELDKIQRRIDQLHGKHVDVTALAAVKASPVVIREGVRVGFIKAFASGGMFRGRGTGTSDSNLARVSDGEFIANARATAKYKPLLEAINEDRLPRYAAGGLVGDRPIERTQRAAERLSVNAATQIALRAAAKLAQVAGQALGGGTGPGGWRWQMHVLRQAFPGLALISGFRPGARTHATGRLSYHALGRAVDVPPSMRVFDWIRSHYGKRTKELIFSPAGRRQLHNGAPHFYTGVTRADHWNHVHWAYDKGGYLPPGLSLAYNGTGRPEPVLGPHQGFGMQVTIDLRGATFLGNARSIANDLAPQMASAIRAEQRRRGVAPTAQLG